MNSERPAASIGKHLEVTTSLGGFYNAEAVLLPGHRQVVRVITSDLKKDAAVRPAFVGLPGRVQEARAEAETGRNLLRVANRVADFLQDGFVRGIHFHVSE